MKKEVHLKDLAPFLNKTLIKIDHKFLKELLIDASQSKRPWLNKSFVDKLGCFFSDKKLRSPTIFAWVKHYKGRAISFRYLKKILELSSYNWNDLENNIISIRAGRRGGEIPLKVPIKISKEIGSLIGHILGDGSIDVRFNMLAYHNSNIELLKEFSVAMKNTLGINPRIWVQKKRKFKEKAKWLKKVERLEDIPKKHNVSLFYPKICSVILYSIFGRFAEGGKKQITDKIRGSNLKFKKGLVRAFFDDEGSITSSSHTARLHQDDRKLLEDISSLIKDIGISTQKVRSYLKRNKLRYYFNINGFKEYYKFYHLIGCTSSKKKKEFELLINKVRNSKQFKKKYAL